MPDDIYTQEYVIDVVTEGAEEARQQLEALDKQVDEVKEKMSNQFEIPELDLSEYISGDIKNLTAEFYDFQEKVNDSSMTFEGMSAQIQLIENDLHSLNNIEEATAEQQKSINGLIGMYNGLLAEAKSKLAGMTSEIQGETNATESLTQAMQDTATATAGIPDTYEELAEAFQFVQAEAETLRLAIKDMVKEIGNSTPSPEQSAELQHRISQYNELLALLEEIKQKMAEMGEQQQDTGKKMEISFKGLINSLKKYGLAFLGVRSTFMIFRRAVNNALSNNIELANKMNAVWNALGNAVAPVVEKFVNGLLTILTYFNIFLKAVSGGKIDLLASTSKSAGSTAKSLKEANKQLAGFDELANIDTNTGSGTDAAGVGGIPDAFSDLNIDTTWAERIQTFGEWVRDNWGLVTGAFIATATAIELIKKGWHGLDILGIGLVILGVGEIIQGVVDTINGIKTGNLDLIADGLAKIGIGIGIVSAGIAILTGSWNGLFGLVIAGVVLVASWVVKHWDEIKYAFTECVDSMKSNWEAFKAKVSEIATAIWSWVTTKWNNIKYAFTECVDSMKSNWEAFKQKVANIATAIGAWVSEKWNGIKQSFINVKDGIVSAWESLKQKVTDVATKVKGVITDIKDAFKEKVNTIIGYVEGAINKMINGINSLIRSINKIKFTTPDWIPLIGGKTFGFNIGQINSVILPRLDTGTNYVPSDQLAMVHKGEAVIPKKFNSQEYFGNSDETNTLLQTLIDKVDSLELNPYITVKDVGEASAKYQNQQYRLRGRALVNG